MDTLKSAFDTYKSAAEVLKGFIINEVKEKYNYYFSLEKDDRFTINTPRGVGIVTDIIVEEEDIDTDILYVRVNYLDNNWVEVYFIYDIDEENVCKYDILFGIADVLTSYK